MLNTFHPSQACPQDGCQADMADGQHLHKLAVTHQYQTTRNRLLEPEVAARAHTAGHLITGIRLAFRLIFNESSIFYDFLVTFEHHA